MRLLLKSSGFIITMFGLLLSLALLLIAGFLWLAPNSLPDLRVADDSVSTSLVLAGIAFGIFFVGVVIYGIGHNWKRRTN